MKKIVKIVAIVVVVVLAVALVAPMLLRGKIAQIVKREANAMLTAQLDFEKLDISLLRHFPHASLELKGLTVVGTEPFAGDTIIAAQRISVVVDVMSLFGDKGFEVTKVILSDPILHAHKLADGRVNWDIVKPSQSDSSASEEPSDAEPSSFRLSVRDFRIGGGSIRYEDDSTGMRFASSPLSLRLRGDLSAAQTDLDLQMTAKGVVFESGGIALLSGAEAELNAVIVADLARKHFAFSHNQLRLNAIEATLDGWVEVQDDAVKMDLTAGCEQVQFKDVLSLLPAFYARDFRNLTAGGELSMSLWARGEMRGATLPAFELKTEVTNGSFQYSSLPRAVDGINIALRVANPGDVMDKTEVDLSKFTLRMAGNNLSASLYGTNLVSDPVFRGTLNGHVDLGRIGEVYPLEKEAAMSGLLAADVKLAGRMSDVENNRYEQMGASGTFVVENLGLTLPGLPPLQIRRAAATITPMSMTLGDFGMTLGNTDLSVTGQLSGYIGYLLRGDRLSGRLYVKSELLDLNELLGLVPDSGEPAEPSSESAAESASAPQVPRNLHLSLSTDLQKVLFQKMVITGISGEVGVADGAVSLERLRMRLFDGTGTASGSYSTIDPARPELKLALGLSGASFSKTFSELDMVQKLVPIFAKTGGDYSLSLDMSAALDAAMEPDMHSVNASGEIKSANIRVQNLGAFEALATALGNDALRKVEAKDVAIRFAIRDGRVTTQPFDLKMGNVNITLSGSTGLDQTIDYTAKVALPNSATGGVLQTINVGIGGTFSAPKITLGLKEAAEEAVKNVIDQQVQKLTGSESLGEEIRKQADNLREEAKKAGAKLVEAAQVQRDNLVEQAAQKGALAKLAAEKAGDKLVQAAQKQSDKLMAEADKQIEKLTAKKE